MTAGSRAAGILCLLPRRPSSNGAAVLYHPISRSNPTNVTNHLDGPRLASLLEVTSQVH